MLQRNWFYSCNSRMLVIFCNKRNQNIVVIIVIGNRIIKSDIRGNLSKILVKYLCHGFGVVYDIIIFAKNYVFFNVIFGINKRFDSGPKMLILWPAVTPFCELLTLRLQFCLYLQQMTPFFLWTGLNKIIWSLILKNSNQCWFIPMVVMFRTWW